MSERVSKYAILSDQVYHGIEGPVRLLYQTTTATLHALPAAVGNALADHAPDRLTETERAYLVDAGVLTTTSEDIPARQQAASSAKTLRKFTLLPTSYCNMGCAYCGQEHTKGILAPHHRGAIAARIDAAMADPGVCEVLVNWFGAEPMMGFAVIRALSTAFAASAERHGKHYSARMVTNGSLLTIRKLRTLHSHCRVQHCEITIDGPAPVHDAHRPLKGGGGSYDKIVETIARALGDGSLGGLSFSIRTNIDANNCDYLDGFFEDLAHRGLAHPRVRFSLKPIHPWGNDISQLQVSRQHYAELETMLLERLLDLGLNIELLPTAPAGPVCSAVTRSAEVISSDGQVFSCTEQPLVPKEVASAVGHLTELPILNLRPAGAFDDWHNRVSRGDVPCSGCVFLPVCGGACPKAWVDGNVPCPSYKLNHQARMRLSAQINGLTEITGSVL
ncbi:radical SAM/SPASM domain-containing protein [Streptantibioticus ferralitis]|uniref:Radical SAM protein n=1 Tax=Streptantibioticus ferralitis TaxID=236510 RepID=A0ABT5Z3M5_9ACTN|nr:radical SAM protein [Streptantibioticus ferralitis]MDF2258424.1 radical SAM protein [Streptantibioticus ferralitis]